MHDMAKFSIDRKITLTQEDLKKIQEAPKSELLAELLKEINQKQEKPSLKGLEKLLNKQKGVHDSNA
jgi:hypothetical protein